MNPRNRKFYIILIITFIIVFLMNYIGSSYPDRLERALMTGASAAFFLGIGLWFTSRNKTPDKRDKFDFD